MALTISIFIILVAILCGFVTIVIYHIRRFHLYKLAGQFPGPPALPVVGNALIGIGKFEDLLNKVLSLTNKYPSPFRGWLGNILMIGFYDAEQLQTILHSPYAIEKDDMYKFFRPIVGTGLFTAQETKWRIHRKLITPTFNTKIIESFVEVYATQSRIMIQQLQRRVGCQEFDIFHYVSLCTFDIICETAMGVSMKAQTSHNYLYAKSLESVASMADAYQSMRVEFLLLGVLISWRTPVNMTTLIPVLYYPTALIGEISFERLTTLWLHPDYIFNRSQRGREYRKCIKYFHKVTDEVILKKKIEYSRIKDERENEAEDSDDCHPRRKAFLDLLMELSHEGTKFSDEELRDEVNTMIIAGNDTTACTITYVILMLAMHQDVQEKVHKELCDIYGNEDTGEKLVTIEDLHRMEYLERVIKETLRLFPVAPFIGRRITRDLNIGRYTLPAGSCFVLAIIRLHRNDQYWPNPMKFDPDRFLPEETAKRHPYCYIPFSAGPRNCIGIKYGMMSMKTLLATVLRRYIIKKCDDIPIENIKLKLICMLKPVDPIMIRIGERTTDE